MHRKPGREEVIEKDVYRCVKRVNDEVVIVIYRRAEGGS